MVISFGGVRIEGVHRQIREFFGEFAGFRTTKFGSRPRPTCPRKIGKRPLAVVRFGTRAIPLLRPGGAILEGTARPGWQAGISPLRIAPKRKSREGAAAVPFIAPNEIRNTNLNAALFGYDREETNALLSGIEASYERVWLEREELRAQVLQLQAVVREHDKLRAQLERIEPELEELRKVDSLLRSALVSAERTTEKLKQEARSEAESPWQAPAA
jgi:hypothetical protein